MSVPPLITRDMLSVLNLPHTAVVAFEEQSQQVVTTAQDAQKTQEAVETQQSAPVLTYAASSTFSNERVLTAGSGVKLDLTADKVTVTFTGPKIEGDRPVTLIATGDTVLALPEEGRLATTANVETLSNKTLSKPQVASWGNYANDAAAASGGVPKGGVYRNGSALMVRVS